MNLFETLHLFLFEKGKHVCPTEVVDLFDNRVRNWLIPPPRLYGDLVTDGMTAVDLGAGGGVNTIEMAKLVGDSGRVISVDIQQSMLDKLSQRVAVQGLSERITTHLSKPETIGLLPASADFQIASMMLHEVPDRKNYLAQIHEIAKPGSRFLIMEPPVHVTRGHFEETVRLTRRTGFQYEGRRNLPVVHTALFRKR